MKKIAGLMDDHDLKRKIRQKAMKVRCLFVIIK